VRSRPVVYVLLCLVLVAPTAFAESYEFYAPMQGEYLEVIAAFIDVDSDDYFPPDEFGEEGPDYFISAILDTGASGNMISVFTQGFSDPLLGDWPGLDLPIKGVNTIEIGGIGSEIGHASVSHPVNVQVNGNYYLQQAVNSNPENIDVDFTGFPQEDNCQMIVATLDGSLFASVDLIGMPFMLDKWTVIYPQERVTGLWNSLLPFDQNTSNVRFFERGSLDAPDCAEWIDLWFPEGPRDNLDDPGDDPSVAVSPEIDGVQLSWNGAATTARMIVDTGAPLTFISSEVALAMGLDPDHETPIDTKLIAGVTGAIVEVPGFMIDYLTLTTMDGDELVYVYTVVYVLDILDEQGDIYTDGLIGNNLFHYELDEDGYYVGYDTIFFDMEEGLLGLNHTDFSATPYKPDALAMLDPPGPPGPGPTGTLGYTPPFGLDPPQPDPTVPAPSALLLAALGAGALLMRRRPAA